MFDKQHIKKVLEATLTLEHLSSFPDLGRLKTLLYKNLSGDATSTIEKKSVSKIIEHHLDDLQAKKEPVQAVPEISEIKSLSDISNMLTSMSIPKPDRAFESKFVDKMVAAINGKLKIASEERNAIINGYLINMGAIGQDQFAVHDFKQVRYQEDEHYRVKHNDFRVIESDGVHKMLLAVVSRGITTNDVRIIEGNRIAVDFEDIGYHANVSGDINPLKLAIERIEKLRSEYGVVSEKMHKHKAVEFLLMNIAKDIDRLYGKTLADTMRSSGEDLHDIVFAMATSKIENSQKMAIDDIEALLNKAPESELVSQHCIQCIKSVGSTIEQIEQWKYDTLKQRYHVDIDFEALDKEYNARINKAMEMASGPDQISFRNYYNSLGAFERMSVDLQLNEIKEMGRAPDSPKVKDNDNVVSLF